MSFLTLPQEIDQMLKKYFSRSNENLTKRLDAIDEQLQTLTCFQILSGYNLLDSDVTNRKKIMTLHDNGVPPVVIAKFLGTSSSYVNKEIAVTKGSE